VPGWLRRGFGVLALLGLLVTGVWYVSTEQTGPPRVAAATPIPPVNGALAEEKLAPHPCAEWQTSIAGVPAVANPFDPDQADVSVEFSGPSARTAMVPAFYTQDFDGVAGPTAAIRPVGPSHWQVRFMPPVEGAWHYETKIVTDGKERSGPAGDFTCTSDPTDHGVLQVSPVDHRYLRYADGTAFYPVGENIGWYDDRGASSYDTWLDRGRAHGVNMIRLWMSEFGFDIEGFFYRPDGTIERPPVGDYSSTLSRAAQLDHVIDAARKRGIVVMISIQNHGPFSSMGPNVAWPDNPYNKANGGPLAQAHDLFTSPIGKKLFERRLRYLVARWGYATNVVWELWNEVDLADNYPIQDVVDWHARMADYLHSIDPERHLVTTSLARGIADYVSKDPQWNALWKLPEIDFVQAHSYGQGHKRPVDFARIIIDDVAAMNDLGKPVLMSETGVSWEGPAQTLRDDPNWWGMHEAMWAPVFAGTSGSGMPWFWDALVDRYGRYELFEGLNELTKGIAFDREGFQRDGAVADAPHHHLKALPLRGRTHTLVWVRNADSWWWRPDSSLISGAHLALSGLSGGTYSVEIIDPMTGSTSDWGTIDVTGGEASIDLPTFRIDIAVRLDLLGDSGSSAKALGPAKGAS
jgi:hypothetical protein